MPVTGIYAVTPSAGMNLYRYTSSQGSQKLLERVTGSDGRAWIYGLCVKVQTSIAAVSVGAAGSITSATTTTAIWMMNQAGGASASKYLWVRKRTLV